jgi:hypothetical protein
MTEKVREIVLKLHSLRPSSAQFVFFDNIFPGSMIAVRQSIMEYKKSKPNSNEIDFIVFSPGGLADDAYRIIRTLRKNFEHVNIIIPFWAKSAATLLSLGGTKIIMDEFGEFGPLDAQLVKAREDSPEYDRESALNDEHSVSIIENRYKMMYEQMYIRLYEHKKINIAKNEVSKQLLDNLSKFFKPLLSQIDPYKLGEKKRKLDIAAQYASRILLQFGSPKDNIKARTLVNYLTYECPDHAYVIDKDVMEDFINNIYSSDTFGEDYRVVLQDLSFYLLDTGDDTDFVGFIEPVEAVEEDEHNKNEDGKEFAGVSLPEVQSEFPAPN